LAAWHYGRQSRDRERDEPASDQGSAQNFWPPA
jgi:hypothetical protein